jgi:predicted PurR-regulated permease PerM
MDNFSIKRLLVVLLSIGALLIFFLFISYFMQVVLIVFSGVLLAILFHIPADWLHSRTKLSERLSFLLSIILFAVLIALVIWLVLPRVLDQSAQIFQRINTIGSDINRYIQKNAWPQEIINQSSDITNLIPNIGNVGSILERVSGVFSGVLGMALSTLIVIILGLYLGYEPQTYTKGLVVLFPSAMRERVRVILLKIGNSLKWWLIGRVVAMVILGGLVGIGLALLGMPVAFGLGVITGLLSFIPIIGSILAIIPAALIAFSLNPLMLLYVFILYAGVQAVETYFLTPLVQRRTVLMSPALALVIQLVMGIVAGPIGVALAYPIAVVGQVLVKLLYLEDVLGESVDVVS